MKDLTDSFLDELEKVGAYVVAVRTPKGTKPTVAGLYQATRRSNIIPVRRAGMAIRRKQIESKAGRWGGFGVGAGGGYMLMKRLIPKGGRFGALGTALGTLGGAHVGKAVGGFGGQVMAHRRLMRGAPVAPNQEPALAPKVKQAIDPISLIAGLKLGILGTNLATRYSTKIPGVRNVVKRIGAEAVGLGARQGASGQPMLTRPTRELLSAFGDPTLVKAYEAGHAAGKRLGAGGLLRTRAAAKGLQKELEKRSPELAKNLKPYAEAIESARLSPTKFDFLFEPVGDVLTKSRLKDALSSLSSSSKKVQQAIKQDAKMAPDVKLPTEVVNALEAARRMTKPV